jgi:hypothetical protein
MNQTSHYTLTMAVLIEAGFDPGIAATIAWANQNVDEWRSGQSEKLKIGQQNIPVPMTQEYGYAAATAMLSKSLLDQLAETVWRPFHFWSGGIDGIVQSYILKDFVNRFSLHSEVEQCRQATAYDMASNRVFRAACLFGIALHVQQDTWSHATFCGWRDDVNSIHGPMDPRSVVPNIGHAESSDPDDPYAMWKRVPDGPTVDNRAKWHQWIKSTFAFLSPDEALAPQVVEAIFLDSSTEAELQSGLEQFIERRSADPFPQFEMNMPTSFDSLTEYHDSNTHTWLGAARHWLELYHKDRRLFRLP